MAHAPAQSSARSEPNSWLATRVAQAQLAAGSLRGARARLGRRVGAKQRRTGVAAREQVRCRKEAATARVGQPSVRRQRLRSKAVLRHQASGRRWSLRRFGPARIGPWHLGQCSRSARNTREPGARPSAGASPSVSRPRAHPAARADPQLRAVDGERSPRGGAVARLHCAEQSDSRGLQNT